MRLRNVLLLASVFLIGCSSLKKVEPKEVGITDYYFQKYVGGTAQSGVNAVYYISVAENSEIELDSIMVEGLSQIKPQKRSNGIWTGTTQLNPASESAQINFKECKLYFRKGEKNYMTTLQNIPEKETVMLPSADGPQEPY